MEKLINKLQNNNIPLDQKDDLVLEYLRANVFGDLIPSSYPQEAFDENSIIFDKPLLEEYALKAKEHLEKLGYEVEVLKDLNHSDRYDTYCIFAYANNKESLEECIAYMLEKECYSLLENENNKDLKQKNISSKRRKK